MHVVRILVVNDQLLQKEQVVLLHAVSGPVNRSLQWRGTTRKVRNCSANIKISLICGQVVNIYSNTHPLTNPFCVWLRCDSSQLYSSPKNKLVSNSSCSQYLYKPVGTKTHTQNWSVLTSEVFLRRFASWVCLTSSVRVLRVIPAYRSQNQTKRTCERRFCRATCRFHHGKMRELETIYMSVNVSLQAPPTTVLKVPFSGSFTASFLREKQRALL